jgi:hypothetical protein
MREVRLLRRQDEELCQRLAMDPYYVSSTTVPTTAQMEALKVRNFIYVRYRYVSSTSIANVAIFYYRYRNLSFF